VESGELSGLRIQVRKRSEQRVGGRDERRETRDERRETERSLEEGDEDEDLEMGFDSAGPLMMLGRIPY
jgi:hypothetical protein